jgi:hypothetical protein
VSVDEVVEAREGGAVEPFRGRLPGGVVQTADNEQGIRTRRCGRILSSADEARLIGGDR